MRRGARHAGSLGGIALVVGASLLFAQDLFWLGEIVASFDGYLASGGVLAGVLLVVGGAPRARLRAAVAAALRADPRAQSSR
jgi:hypothetical protein